MYIYSVILIFSLLMLTVFVLHPALSTWRAPESKDGLRRRAQKPANAQRPGKTVPDSHSSMDSQHEGLVKATDCSYSFTISLLPSDILLMLVVPLGLNSLPLTPKAQQLLSSC